MSPAFGAAFLWLLTTILWWSGWREESKERLPHWAVGVFLAVWPMALLINVKLTLALTFNGAWLWTLVAIVVLAVITPSVRRWMAMSSGVLLGAVYVLISRLAYYPSGFSHAYASWLTAMIVGALAAVLLRGVSEQVLAISAAFYLSDGITAFVHSSMASEAIPISRAMDWMEAWWVALLSARLGTISVKATMELARRWAPRWGGRGGQRW
ncbi:hypothetical protein [Cohnella endophytica]|nr:hypothetical protein [Cohnella endophytica]